MQNNDIIIAVAGIIFIVAVIAGFVRQIIRHSKGEKDSDIDLDSAADVVKDIIVTELANILHNAGITSDYETFKNYVLYELLDKVRKYIDEKGGLIDDVTDAISDDSIIECINQVIKMSGVENEIKSAYDQLVTDRLKEIEDSEKEEVEKNAILESESLSKYKDDEIAEEEEPSDDEIQVDEEDLPNGAVIDEEINDDGSPE